MRKHLLRISIEPDDEHTNEGFQASEGWFKMWQSLHSIKTVRTTSAAATYPEEFSKLITDLVNKPEQVFNADETALFWNRTPNKTFISTNEKSASGFKIAKDRITLLLYANASAECLSKSCMFNRSLNQIKNNLPVFWYVNKQAWVLSITLSDWCQNCFVAEIEI